jgi:hypothetical protein
MPSRHPLPEDLTQLAPPQELATAWAMVSSLVARVQQAEARTHELEAPLKQAEAQGPAGRGAGAGVRTRRAAASAGA